jgi:hypothetical protein
VRTSTHHLHLPHHSSGWWVGHIVLAVVLGALLVYGAAVLVALALYLVT